MIEIYEGEATVSQVVPVTYDVTAVTITQRMYSSVTGERDDEIVTPAYTEENIGNTPTHKYVHVVLGDISQWPTSFELRIDVEIDAVPRFIKVDYNVVTPYVSVVEIALAGELDMDNPASPNYKSYNTIRDMESLARHIIESYTGKFFGRSYDKWDADGTDSTELYSSDKVVWVGAVMHDDDVIFGENTGTCEVSDSRNLISVKDDGGESYGFPEHYSYSVIGIKGEDSVPYDVVLAAKQLAVHYLCNDSATTNKFIDQVKFGESANRWNRQAFSGTGLHAADLLLGKYRFHNYKVI
jgi:hypothetical protein